MTRTAWIALLAAVALAGAAVVSASFGEDADAVELRPDDVALVAMGRSVYDANCASCHGANLEGQPNWKIPGPDGKLPAPPHDETGHTWHHDDATLFALTKHGLGAMLGPDSTYESAMPAYEGVLTDREIIAALSYIKSRWPAETRALHDERNERAKARP